MKRMKQKSIALLMAFLPVLALSAQTAARNRHGHADAERPVWQPDLGNGSYQNPVLYADYSDPDVCAVGDDYFLTASSFQCVPGLPILHSRDLVNWRIIGHALPQLEPREEFAQPQHGKGVWAPSIRHHDGRFYIYWGDPDRGIFMVQSERADSGWSRPVCVVEGRGLIDPCPLWDDDGRCYLVNAWAASRAGFNSVLAVRELSADGTHAIGQPRIVFDGGQLNHTAEGPKFYRRDGYYWILCPAGGVAMGWQLAMRSRSVYGPYEWKRVLWQGNTDINGPHQGGWVHTPYGEDWFLHFNDKGAYGRVVYLQPVDWSSGWPMMGNNGEPYARYRKPNVSQQPQGQPSVSLSAQGASARADASDFHLQSSDEFDGTRLGLQWQWHANYDQTYGMLTPDGCMRLYTWDKGQAGPNLWAAPNLLLQKLAAPAFTATAKVCFSAKEAEQRGGLLLMGRDYSALVVRSTPDSTFLLQQLTCIGADEGAAEQVETLATIAPTKRDSIQYSPAIHLTIYLRTRIADGHCRFAYSTDGRRYRDVGRPFTLKEGKWIGAKLGFLADCTAPQKLRGWLDVDWVRMTNDE